MDSAWRDTGCGAVREVGIQMDSQHWDLGKGENGVSAPGLRTHEEVAWGRM